MDRVCKERRGDEGEMAVSTAHRHTLLFLRPSNYLGETKSCSAYTVLDFEPFDKKITSAPGTAFLNIIE